MNKIPDKYYLFEVLMDNNKKCFTANYCDYILDNITPEEEKIADSMLDEVVQFIVKCIKNKKDED